MPTITTDTTGSLGSNGAYASDARDPVSEIRHYAKSALDAVAQLGQYLEQSDFESLRHDAERQIRERPLTAVAVGLGLGFILGKLLKD